MKRIGEYITLSLRNIRYNITRSILTMSIIAFGIMSLVSILTATDALKASVNSNFSKAGATTFSITTLKDGISLGGPRNQERFPDFSYKQALQYAKNAEDYCLTSVYYYADFDLSLSKNKAESKGGRLVGCNAEYFSVFDRLVEFGRSFTSKEVASSATIAVIGHNQAVRLFDKPEEALGQTLKVGRVTYTVIGVVEDNPESNGFSVNQFVYIPISAAKQFHTFRESLLRIESKVLPNISLSLAMEQALLAMRKARKLRPNEVNSFSVASKEDLLSSINDILNYIGGATSSIGVLTLIGSMIALLNIMLVSVTERTKEIGVRKAVGASAGIIKAQFLVESITISSIGGILGMLLGILMGNIVSIFLKSNFYIPWDWMFYSFLVSVFVGALSGWYPAERAASKDPISSLQHNG